jgi:DNA-binding winged helix-turn-helix (wHTH) protein
VILNKDSKVFSIHSSNRNQNDSLLCSEHCLKCKRYVSEDIRLSESVFFSRSFLHKDELIVKLSYAAGRVLCLLQKNIDKYISVQDILDYVWGSELRVANNVNVAISELRIALSRTEFYILNKRKVGYMLTRVNF